MSAVRIMNARYRGQCAAGCGQGIRKGERIAYIGKGNVFHAECYDEDAEDGTVIDANQGLVDAVRPVRVHVTRFSSGHTVTTNVRGRCEDAPCCGCCTF